MSVVTVMRDGNPGSSTGPGPAAAAQPRGAQPTGTELQTLSSTAFMRLMQTTFDSGGQLTIEIDVADQTVPGQMHGIIHLAGRSFLTTTSTFNLVQSLQVRADFASFHSC